MEVNSNTTTIVLLHATHTTLNVVSSSSSPVGARKSPKPMRCLC
uniref:Uncharacterized protein n=1 Tax=Setaria italica TaxID=4555 RepID=K4A402_SETIT